MNNTGNENKNIKIEKINNILDAPHNIQMINTRINQLEKRVETLERELEIVKVEGTLEQFQRARQQYEAWSETLFTNTNLSIKNMTIYILWSVLMLMIIYASLMAMWNHSKTI